MEQNSGLLKRLTLKTFHHMRLCVGNNMTNQESQLKYDESEREGRDGWKKDRKWNGSRESRWAMKDWITLWRITQTCVHAWNESGSFSRWGLRLDASVLDRRGAGVGWLDR